MSAGEPHGTRRALGHVRAAYPGRAISLLVPVWEAGFFAGRDDLSALYVYEWGPGHLWNATRKLLGELQGRHFELMILMRPQGLRVIYGHFLNLLSYRMRIDRRVVISDDSSMQLLDRRSAILTLLDLGTFALARPLARLVTRAVFFVVRAAPDEPPPPSAARPGAIAFLVPVLPDLSHTFVYREVLGILAQHAREQPTLVVALEEGSHSVVHEEARQLLGHSIFVPTTSLVGYLLLYGRYLLTRPRRLARLVRLFAEGAPEDPCLFLRGGTVNGLHPSTGLPLARLLERERVSYIHCHGMSYPATRALVASGILNVPFSISTFVDFDYPYPFKCLKAKLETARFVVTCTAFCRTRLLALTSPEHAGKIQVIHHALDPSYAGGAARTTESPARAAHPRVFTACRFVEKKGLEYLVEACSVLKRRGLPVRGLLIGDGEERTRLQRLAQELDLTEELIFPGAIRNDEI